MRILSAGHSAGELEISGSKTNELKRNRSPLTQWLVAGVCLVITYGVPAVRLPLSVGVAIGLSPMEAWLVLPNAQVAIALAVVLGVVVLIERRPLASIGMRKPNLMDFLAASLVVGLIFPAAIAGQTLARLVHADALSAHAAAVGTATLAKAPMWAQALTMVLAASIEEIGDRAYTIERLAELTGSVLWSSLAALIFILLAHVPFWGIPYLYLIAPGEILFVLLYVWRRNAPISVITHIVINALALWL
jgi:uncharacterized protein